MLEDLEWTEESGSSRSISVAGSPNQLEMSTSASGTEQRNAEAEEQKAFIRRALIKEEM